MLYQEVLNLLKSNKRVKTTLGNGKLIKREYNSNRFLIRLDNLKNLHCDLVYYHKIYGGLYFDNERILEEATR